MQFKSKFSKSLFRPLLYFLCFLLGTAYTAGAQGLLQEYANQRQKKIPVRDSLKIDSVAISSFSIPGINPSDYRISPYAAVLYWNKRPQQDSVTVRYRALALDFTKVYRNKNRSVVDSNYFFSSSAYRQGGSSNRFVDYDQVEMNGSYGRSISLGNNQDVVSNSNLNLQVNGYLIDSIKVEAAITDNTI
ncbi:MAG: hypothetical protein JNL13_02065, partial [Chitinophagaceae bacterium]|nr:hypothetical protein [Chitinophagaceae bacterium]